MGGHENLLDRAVPDRVDTRALPASLAAEIDHLAGRRGRWTSPEVGPGVRARALVDAGDVAGARRLLGEVDILEGPTELVAAVWAASRVGPAVVLDRLEAPVEALGAGFVVDADVALGPSALHAGRLAAARGDLGSGRALLERAVAEGDRRAPVWGARARLELARVLWTSSAVEPDAGELADAARRAASAAQTFFAATGHRHLGAECRALDQPVVDGLARPLLGHLVEDGATWQVGFGVVPVVGTAAGKGLVALRHLVRNGDRPVPAVELDRVVSGEPVGELAILTGDLLERLEQGAAAASELRAVLMDERVRSRVTKLVRRTVEKLAEAHPVLGRHLRTHVTTGYACRYVAPGAAWDT